MMSARHSTTPANVPRYTMTLRAFLMGTLMLVLLPIIAIIGGVSYRNADLSSQKYTTALGWEIGGRVRDRVIDFFNVPRQVVSHNVELARAGLLGHEKRDELMHRFLLQIRQHPGLTFISMGMADGNETRMLHARHADGGRMHIYSTNEAGRKSTLVSTGTLAFDARKRPWFKTAVAANGMRWYPIYRYAINATDKKYETLGVGIAAPLIDNNGQFIGVATADVALSNLGHFLREQTQQSGAVAFIADSDGELTATSTQEPIFRHEGDEFVRIKAAASKDPLIRAANIAIKESKQAEGNTFAEIDGQSYLINWQSYTLTDGPTLLIGVILSKAPFDAMARDTLRNIVYLGLGVSLLSLLIGLFTTHWVARPLAALSRVSARLAAGDLRTPLPESSPIREVASLQTDINSMVMQLQHHTSHLEELVAERTEKLEAANHLLKQLSLTDSLTGLANRRHFTEQVSIEVKRAQRSQAALSLLMIDLDHFKRINDSFGHAAGDEVLRSFAALIALDKRPSDLIARIGGEEFAILLPDTGSDGAHEFAQRILDASRRQTVVAPKADGAVSIQYTVSIGIAQFVEGTDNYDTLLGHADEALYRAKAAGRDRMET